MDKYQKFGIGALVFSLLFMLFGHGQGIEDVLFIGGVVYGLVFIFHSPLERFIIPKTNHPVLLYGMLVLLNGLFVEVLAYIGNLPKIEAGKQAFLFSTSSLSADILLSLPYYIILAVIYMLVMKKYELTTFKLGVIIALFWAMFVDAKQFAPFVWVGSHFIGLF